MAIFGNKKTSFITRLDQIGVALIPVFIGFLALINDITGLHATVNSVVKPLVTMQGNTTQAWRALPASIATFVYILMFLGEFLVGVLAVISVFLMLKNIRKDSASFENAKRFIYIACGWGIIVWGLGFFEIGGDWFLAWQNTNLASFQQESLMYVLELTVTFIYLKLSKN